MRAMAVVSAMAPRKEVVLVVGICGLLVWIGLNCGPECGCARQRAAP